MVGARGSRRALTLHSSGLQQVWTSKATCAQGRRGNRRCPAEEEPSSNPGPLVTHRVPPQPPRLMSWRGTGSGGQGSLLAAWRTWASICHCRGTPSFLGRWPGGTGGVHWKGLQLHVWPRLFKQILDDKETEEDK